MDITVYTSVGWGPCHMVKVYLSRKGLSFTERNISLDDDAKADLLSMGYRSTPVTVINDQQVVGYSPPKLEAAIQTPNI